MSFTLDSLDVILSYTSLDRGLHLELALVSTSFSVVAKRYIDRYRKTYEYYTTNFISLDEYNYAKQLLPNIRFLVKGWRLKPEEFHKINNGRIIKYKSYPSLSVERFLIETYDTSGKLHSYNDEPAHDYCTVFFLTKKWYHRGTLSRENDNPVEIRVPSGPEYYNQDHVLEWKLLQDTDVYVNQYCTLYIINGISYYIERSLNNSIFFDAYKSGVVPEDLKKRLLKAPDIDCSKCMSRRHSPRGLTPTQICMMCTRLIECPKCFYVWRQRACWESSSNDECSKCGYQARVAIPV